MAPPLKHGCEGLAGRWRARAGGLGPSLCAWTCPPPCRPTCQLHQVPALQSLPAAATGLPRTPFLRPRPRENAFGQAGQERVGARAGVTWSGRRSVSLVVESMFPSGQWGQLLGAANGGEGTFETAGERPNRTEPTAQERGGWEGVWRGPGGRPGRAQPRCSPWSGWPRRGGGTFSRVWPTPPPALRWLRGSPGGDSLPSLHGPRPHCDPR